MLVPQLRRPVEDGDQELQVVFDRPVGHRASARADPACPPRPDEPVPVPLGQRRRVAVPSEAPEEHPRRGPVVPPSLFTLGGRHFFTVDVKKRLQGERLGLGFGLAMHLRPGEARGELVRLLLRPCPFPVLERPAEPAPVRAPLDLEQAGLGIGKDPYPVPAPFASGVAPLASFRACHHSIPLSMMDCTICASETWGANGFLTSGVGGLMDVGLPVRPTRAKTRRPVPVLDPPSRMLRDSRVRSHDWRSFSAAATESDSGGGT